MIAKLQALAESVKAVLLYILLPFVFVAGFIWYLWSGKEQLETALKAKDGEEKLNELQGEEKSVDTNASDSVNAYEQLRNKYLSDATNVPTDNSSSGQSNSQSTGPNSK